MYKVEKSESFQEVQRFYIYLCNSDLREGIRVKQTITLANGMHNTYEK